MVIKSTHILSLNCYSGTILRETMRTLYVLQRYTYMLGGVIFPHIMSWVLFVMAGSLKNSSSLSFA